MMIRKQAFPRAALIGNPSDGYYGKTIAFVFDNYAAQVMLYETPQLELVPSLRDKPTFTSVYDLVQEVGLYGYYGGIRLLKASIKRFVEYCQSRKITLHDRNFTMRYGTTIPNRLGLAGINAGLQDRVAQAYNVPVFMDFNRDYMEKNGYGIYSELTIPDDLNLFVAFRTDLAEGSEILHSRLREDYNNKIPAVLDAIAEWAHLSDVVKDALSRHNYSEIEKALRRNFELRCKVCASTVSAKNRRMVDLADSLGAAAKLTGSGGAIIGIYHDENHYRKLQELFNDNQIEIVKPHIVTGGEAVCNW